MRKALIGGAALMLASCGEAAPEVPQQLPTLRFEQISSDPVAHGERLVRVLGCVGCHDDSLLGRDWSDPDYGTLWTANLTRSAKTYSHDELAAMITEGKRPDRALWEMPSFLFSDLHPDDVSAVVAYLATLEPEGEVHPDPTIGPKLQQEIDSGEFVDSVGDVAAMRDRGPPDLGPTFAFGRHILRATCAECHGMDLRGKPAPDPDASARPDLRMVASYSREDFAILMQTGKAAGGRELELMSGVARRRYAHFTEAEEDAVYAYLGELARRDP